MSLLDYIPIGSTIKHATQDVKGSKVEDYTCNMDKSFCGQGPEQEKLARVACEKDIDQQMIKYLQDYCGGGVLSAVMHDAVGDIVALLIAYFLKVSVVKLAGLSLGGVTIVLALDTFIDLGIVINEIGNIGKAAKRAKQICCKCYEEPCPTNKLNTQKLEFIKWYWGIERSMNRTKRDAQGETDMNYNCLGSCQSGNCKPKIYVQEWSQGGFGMTRTKLTYDVYCKCS